MWVLESWLRQQWTASHLEVKTLVSCHRDPGEEPQGQERRRREGCQGQRTVRWGDWPSDGAEVWSGSADWRRRLRWKERRVWDSASPFSRPSVKLRWHFLSLLKKGGSMLTLDGSIFWNYKITKHMQSFIIKTSIIRPSGSYTKSKKAQPTRSKKTAVKTGLSTLKPIRDHLHSSLWFQRGVTIALNPWNKNECVH